MSNVQGEDLDHLDQAQNLKQEESLYLIVDGGGTKTIVAIVNQNGIVLTKIQTNATNYQVVGKVAAIQTLRDAIDFVIQQLKETWTTNKKMNETILFFKRAVFALAGIDTKKDQNEVELIVQKVLEETNVRVDEVIIENDALASLLGATKNGPGVVLISGTGSISYAHDGKGNYFRIGGWGNILGDEGSGYWIGKEALKTVLRMADGREKKTILYDYVLEFLQMDHYEQLYNWVYSSKCTVDQVASIAKVVENARLAGERTSEKIIQEAINELYQLVITAVQKVGNKNHSIKLILLGGVLQNNEYMKTKLIQMIERKVNTIEIVNHNKKPFQLIIQRAI